MRRVLVASASLAATLAVALALFATTTLPPRAVRLVPEVPHDRAIWGAYHVHTARSDGGGSPDDVALAAARTGLHFVIFTDHGDGTRAPDPPAYRHGVLCIDAVEISTDDGHLVALGLNAPSPYPLGGMARDVIEDVQRLGGWTVMAHPDSPRPDLRWRGPGGAIDGLEWLNVDSEWRAHRPATLAAAALRAIIRPPESIGSILRKPEATLRRWDALLRARPVIGLAAVDAHARLGADGNGGAGASLRLPGYAILFRTAVQGIVLQRPLTGDASIDAAEILRLIREGRSYSIVRALADVLPEIELGVGRDRDGSLRLVAGIKRAPRSRLVLLENGRPVTESEGHLDHAVPDRGGPYVYRIEGFLERQAMPWLLTNAVRVVDGEVTAPGPAPGGDERRSLPSVRTDPRSTVEPTEFAIEADPSSAGAWSRETSDSLRFAFELGRGPSPFVALASPMPAVPVERIEFEARSDSPLRVSVQVRVPGGTEGRRWRRSVYVDAAPRFVSLRLADLDPVDRRSPLRPVAARLQSVLFVIDSVNTSPGTAGTIRLGGLRVIRAAPEQDREAP